MGSLHLLTNGTGIIEFTLIIKILLKTISSILGDTCEVPCTDKKILLAL